MNMQFNIYTDPDTIPEYFHKQIMFRSKCYKIHVHQIPILVYTKLFLFDSNQGSIFLNTLESVPTTNQFQPMRIKFLAQQMATDWGLNSCLKSHPYKPDALTTRQGRSPTFNYFLVF